MAAWRLPMCPYPTMANEIVFDMFSGTFRIVLSFFRRAKLRDFLVFFIIKEIFFFLEIEFWFYYHLRNDAISFSNLLFPLFLDKKWSKSLW
jgi:hypothetical protein